MRLIRNQSGLQVAKGLGLIGPEKPSAVTIGNFDALHLGHQSLIDTLKKNSCKYTSVNNVLLTFYPHPRVILNRQTRYFHLLSFSEKYRLVEQQKINFLLAIRVDNQFLKLSAEDFIKSYLVQGLYVKLVVIGEDWRFGKNRAGDVEFLKKCGIKFNFEVKVVSPILYNNVQISSSSIKALLSKGDVKNTKNLLGRYFSVSGRVVQGRKEGGKIGFPTLNLLPFEHVLPKDGVYVTQTIIGSSKYNSVASVGISPMFGGEKEIIETHIFDSFSQDLYGKKITVEFIDFLRDQQCFSSIDQLKNAITADITNAKKILQLRT